MQRGTPSPTGSVGSPVRLGLLAEALLHCQRALRLGIDDNLAQKSRLVPRGRLCCTGRRRSRRAAARALDDRDHVIQLLKRQKKFNFISYHSSLHPESLLLIPENEKPNFDWY